MKPSRPARDGVQTEPGVIATFDKVALIDCLSRAGFRRIAAARFISSKWVPQMADGAGVLAGIAGVPGVAYLAPGHGLRVFDASNGGLGG